MVISKNAENATAFCDKMLENLVRQATKVVLNLGKLESFSLKSGTRQRCMLFLLLSDIQCL